MRVICKVSLGKRGSKKKKVIVIPDREVSHLTEEQKIEAIERYFNKWLDETIDANWEIED